MLLDEFLNISITGKNIKYYQRKYPNLIIGNELNIPISTLSENSGYKVNVRCDYCGLEFKMEYRKYLRSIQISEKNSCKKTNCSNLKVKESNIKKYGVENVMQLDSNKIKSKKSNLERWGTENPNDLEIIKDKVRKTNIERYGISCYLKTEEFKLKSKISNLERWGTDNPNELEIIKNKIKGTSLNKWGVDNYTQTEEYKIRSKETNLEKWGVNNYAQTDEYKEKTKKTNLEKWGFEVTSHSEEYRKINYKIAKHPNYLKYHIDEKMSEFKCDCEQDHTFKINIDNFHHRITYMNPLCTVCYPISDSRSIKEEELFKLIKSVYVGEIIQSYRDGFEIDIYLPELKLGFEFNGLRWHSNVYRENDYHLKKTNYFSERGIRIIHIWEDDFDNKRNIVDSQIKNILNKTENKIFARKCMVIEMTSVNDFLEKNHIQGGVRSVIKLGLYHNSELISVMTFDQFEGRKKMCKDGWNLNRFCSKLNTTVIGGASKLLQYFINKYNPSRIISYADKDWSIGSLYQSLKFVKISESKPDYKYVIGGKRTHKSNFRKSVTKISESKLDIPRVYDCGKIKYEKKFHYDKLD